MNDAPDRRAGSTSAPPPTISTVLIEGFITGIIGAGVVAAWFLLLDTLTHQPLWTPSLLGTVLFRGPEAAVANHAVIDPGMVAGYTIVHHLAFMVVGVLASFLISEMKRIPPLGIALLFLFVFVETGFLIFVLSIGEPLLEGISLWAVAVANLLAATAMAGYLWYRQPRILAHFERIWEAG